MGYYDFLYGKENRQTRRNIKYEKGDIGADTERPTAQKKCLYWHDSVNPPYCRMGYCRLKSRIGENGQRYCPFYEEEPKNG